jgi:hypothetical protein
VASWSKRQVQGWTESGQVRMGRLSGSLGNECPLLYNTYHFKSVTIPGLPFLNDNPVSHAKVRMDNAGRMEPRNRVAKRQSDESVIFLGLTRMALR